jgi:hypothetical protein
VVFYRGAYFLTSYNASRESVSELLKAEKGHDIPWSKTLQTIDGERICVVNLDIGLSPDYPVLCLVDYGSEIGFDIYTEDGEYDIGVPSGNSLIPIPK